MQYQNTPCFLRYKYKIRTVAEPRETNLSKICKKIGMNQVELAREADLELAQLNKIWHGKYVHIHLSTMRRICNVVNKNLHQVFGD